MVPERTWRCDMYDRGPFACYICTNVRMYECTNIRIYECTNVRMYECMNVRIYEYTNIRIYECTNVRMYEDIMQNLVLKPKFDDLLNKFIDIA